MGSSYLSLVRHLSFCAVRLKTCIPPSTLITGRIIATWTFFCVVMYAKYLLVSILENYWPLHHRIVRVIRLRPRLVARIRVVSCALRSETLGLCILLRLCPRTSSFSGLGLAHFHIEARGIHIYTVSRVALCWYKAFSCWQ